MIYVTCALIEQGGKILVTQRSATMDLPFKWEFPGGKLQQNESVTDCIRREIQEELQLEVEPFMQLPKSVHDYGTKVICLIPLVCRIRSGRLHLMEHEQYRWVLPAALREMDWCPADVPVVEDYLAWRQSGAVT